MFRENRNLLRTSRTGRPPKFDYAEVISVALRHELGSDAQSIKIIANWTGATDRTVTNWLAGHSGPKGLYLMRLLRKSDAILETVLSLAARADILELFYESKRLHRAGQAAPSAAAPTFSRMLHGPHGVPHDPQTDPHGVEELGTRQIWFLQEIRHKPSAKAKDIASLFGVSSKTAKRDIAYLKQRQLIIYEGSSRKGRYVRLALAEC